MDTCTVPKDTIHVLKRVAPLLRNHIFRVRRFVQSHSTHKSQISVVLYPGIPGNCCEPEHSELYFLDSLDLDI